MLGSGLIHLGWTCIRFNSYIPRVQELEMNDIRVRTKSLEVDLYWVQENISPSLIGD